MMVREQGRFSGVSPSQSYACGSTTTLFMAVAALSPSMRGCVTAVVFRNRHGAAVRVEEELGRIKAKAARGIEWSVNPKAVDLACLHTGNEHDANSGTYD